MTEPATEALSREIWRVISRHPELRDAVLWITALLRRRGLDFEALMVRRLDLTGRLLDTAAYCPVQDDAPPLPTRTRLQGEESERVLRFWRAGQVQRLGAADRPDSTLVCLLPSGWSGDALVGPVVDAEHGTQAVALLLGKAGQLAPEQAGLLALLLEPLGVAVANDHRFQELTRLRDASDADRRVLSARRDRRAMADAIIGADGGLAEVMERLDQVAATDVPVLILGETGTGKEIVARALHARSPRAGGPMVRVNCGAISPGLIDSELFGHEKGSFTGAVESRRGWFERAHGGTLFLDEVGELSLEAQVRFLRVLQEGVVQRVGGHQDVPVDVRIAAATNRDLQQMVEGGRFREDLWYRLSVFPIRLPPLRERPSDIPDLAAHFARQAGMRLRGVPLAPSPRDLEILVWYSWPGNIRELATVIERAAILGGGRRLEVEAALKVTAQAGDEAALAALAEALPDLEGEAGESDPAPPLYGRGAAPAAAPALGVPSLDEAVRAAIEAALLRARGRIEGRDGAAKLLRVNPHTLRAKMRKLGIDWARFRAD